MIWRLRTLLYLNPFTTEIEIIGLVNNIPTMQYFNGISRNAQSKSCTLSLTEAETGSSEIIHCGILNYTPYWL